VKRPTAQQEGWEPLDAWRVYAHQLNAALSAVAWQQSHGENDEFPAALVPYSPQLDSGHLSPAQSAHILLTRWLIAAPRGYGHVRLWDPEAQSSQALALEFSLQAVLAHQLDAVLSRPEGIRVCPYCRGAWEPKKPRSDRASPCENPECKAENRRRWDRDRKRRERARQREERARS
jgi:hypothetical protein